MRNDRALALATQSIDEARKDLADNPHSNAALMRLVNAEELYILLKRRG